MKTLHLVLFLLVAFMGSNTAFGQDPYTGLKVHYPFDDIISSTTDDHSGFFNNAIVGSGATQTPNRHGTGNNAFYLDATLNGYVEVLNSPSINNALVNSNNATSVSFWFNPTDWSTMAPFNPERMVLQLINGTPASNSGSVDVYWNPITMNNPTFGNVFSIMFWNGVTITHLMWSTGMYTTNAWHHVVINIDWWNSTVDLYVDNVLDVSSAGWLSKPASPKIEIGRHLMTGSNREFEGGIDEVRMYDKLLSTSEIDLLYNDLHQVAYYPLASNANDYSGFGNHSVNIGTALTSSTDRMGNISQAYGFNGTTSSFLATDWTSPSPTLDAAAMPATCVSVWVNPSSKAPAYPNNRSICQLIDKHNTTNCNIYDLFYNYSTRRFLIANWNGSIVVYTYSNRTYAPGSWHHLVAIYDPTNAQCALYVDDSLDISITGVTLAPPSKSWLEIGEHHYWCQDNYIGQDWNFKGDIDGMRVFNALLSRSEISGLYSGTNLNKPGPLGIASLENGTLSVFPNPASNQITIRSDRLTQGNQTINIYDITGKKLITEQPPSGTANTRTLDVQCLTPGVYVVELIGPAGTKELAKFTRQ